MENKAVVYLSQERVEHKIKLFRDVPDVSYHNRITLELNGSFRNSLMCPSTNPQEVMFYKRDAEKVARLFNSLNISSYSIINGKVRDATNSIFDISPAPEEAEKVFTKRLKEKLEELQLG